MLQKKKKKKIPIIFVFDNIYFFFPNSNVQFRTGECWREASAAVCTTYDVKS